MPRRPMERRCLPILLCLTTALCTSVAVSEDRMPSQETLSWTELPPLPDPVGVAGPFTGVHNDALIVAGGANFPKGKPWEGGRKVWHDRIHVMTRTETGSYAWVERDFRLPRPLAYGVTISTPNGLVCIGGCDADKAYADVFRLQWNPDTSEITQKELPPLPFPLSFMGGAKLGNTVYVVTGHRDGKHSQCFLSFSLQQQDGEYTGAWKELPDFPGEKRIIPTVAAQNNGMQNCLYVFSGRSSGALHTIKAFSDSWAYDPKQAKWTQKRDILGTASDGSTGVPVAAAPCMPIGAAHILVFGGGGSKSSSLGSRVDNAAKAFQLREQAKAEPDGAQKSSLTQQADKLDQLNRELMKNDRGHSNTVLSYHAITDTWTPVGTMPAGKSVVTATAVKLGDRIVIASGETRPGVRTPAMPAARVEVKAHFGAINYAVLIVYLASLVGMGIYFAKREKSTKDFFLAGKRIPWWAAGLSIYATQLSAITFVSTPAVAFGQNWLTYLPRLSLLLMVPVVVCFYLPFYRRLNLTTAYEYLEKRFNLGVRMFGSLSFIIFQLARMGVVVYLPALALSTITGLDIYVSIVLMGVLSIVYTVLGGMEAVIWTDVMQVVVLMGGMLILVGIVLFDVGGIGEVFRVAAEDNKLIFFDWDFSLRTMNTWILFIGFFALQFGFTTDQAIIQRYLTTKDEKAAAKSIWTHGFMAVPGAFLFFVAGACLYAFFRNNPQFLAVGMAKDEVLPLFVSNHLPVGISGLVIAGIFAASMSSLDSSMHSVSTSVTTDFFRRFRPDLDDHACLNIARWVTVIVGLAGMAFACYLASSTATEMYFTFQKLGGVISSSLAGIFILGIFTKRATGPGALVGGIIAFTIVLCVRYQTDLHFYTHAVVGILSCVSIGYVLSLVLPSKQKDLTGLCWWTRRSATSGDG